jgi:hypothetical protein
MAHKAMREMEDEKDQIANDMNNQRNLSYTLEMNKGELHRHTAQIENDNKYLQQQMKDLKKEVDIMR